MRSGRSGPLADPHFRLIIYATALSLCAFWMNDVASSWLMREMTGADPFMVSLVQLALQLPIMLALFPAGVLSDLSDRVRLLLLAQLWLAAVTLVLVALYAGDALTPLVLLAALALLGLGSALRMPNVNALVAETVQPAQLTAAMSLSLAVVNGSRMLGPAIAGLVLALHGVAAVFVLNVVFLGVAFAWVRRLPRQPAGAARVDGAAFVAALKAGLRTSLGSGAQRQLVAVSAVFAGSAAVVVALLPVLFDSTARYGAMYAVYGAGAMSGAIAMTIPACSAHLAVLMRGGIAASAAAMLVLAFASHPLPVGAALFVAGLAWIVVLNSTQVTAALQLEASQRGRGLSILYVGAVGGMAAASPLWGLIARHDSPALSFLISAGTSCTLLALIVLRRR